MNFDGFYEALRTYPSIESVFTVYDVVLNFCLPAILLIPISIIYKRTHKSVTYNQNFVHTMFILAVITSVIMMIIGSNIARAFSLVGALSIIRFRTAVKDTKDTGYIFSAIALGMAPGTGMYIVAVTMSVLISGLLFALNFFKVGEKVSKDKLLKLTVPDKKEVKEELSKILMRHTKTFALVNYELAGTDNLADCTYVVTTDDKKDDRMMEDLKLLTNNHTVSLFYNDQRIEI